MEKITYLVDTENVGSVWKILLDQLTKQDRLILFYTDYSPCVSYTDLKYILDYSGQFEMIKCYTGKNALDFQLVSYLGYLLRTAQKTKYIIISNDFGYDPVVKFWTERGGNIKRYNAERLYLHKKERITGQKKKIVLQKEEQDSSKEKSSDIKELEATKTIESEEKKQINNKEQINNKKRQAEDKEEQINNGEELTENKEKEQMKQGVLDSLKDDLEQQNVWKDVIDAIVFDEEEDRTNEKDIEDREENEIQHIISKIFKGLITEEETELLISVLFSDGKKKLQKIYTGLIKNLGAERGAEIYRKVKPHLNEIYRGL